MKVETRNPKNAKSMQKLLTLTKKSLLVWSAYIIFPSIAFAGGDTVSAVIKNLTDYLSGTIAIAIGVLAVIYSGYEMLIGEIDKRALMTRCIAIGVIIGGSWFASNVIMKGI